MTSTTVMKKDLMAVINEARLHGISRLHIRSILLDTDLLYIDLETNTVESIADREGFERARSSVIGGREGKALEDLPTYDDLKIAIWNSVILPDEVVHPILKELEAIAENRTDPYRYPRQVCFAIDTNIAYHRLFSRMLLKGDLLGRLGPRLSDVQIIVSNIVEEEISHAIANKYSQEDIELLKMAVRDQVLTSTMFNICYRKGRKALNAQAEIDLLSKRTNLWRVGGFGITSDNKEEIDDEIVRSLALHAANNRLDLIFVTGDDKCRAHAYAHKLPSILIRYPRTLPDDISFDPWLLVELLYDLSVSFVGLSLPELDMKITGDWTGKSAQDYHDEKVKLIFGHSSLIEGELQRDLVIIRGLEEMLEGQSIKNIT